MGRRAARTVTARRRRDEEALLEAVRAEADEAARARPALLSLLSHDLTNPLSVILVSLRILGRTIGEEHAGRRHLDAIGRAADEMQTILQDMSDVARIEEGRLTLSLSREDVGGLIARAADVARHAARAKDVSIQVSTDPRLGLVLCDRDRVQRLLAGLVASAVRGTPRGSSVTIRAAESSAGRRISVTCGGHGIRSDAGDRVFELPSGGRARPPGIGLALYAARGVIEAHGGTIALEPEPAGGSTFVVTLPES